MKEPTPKQIRSVMSALGKRTSEAKAAASRENGKKGGRPKLCPTCRGSSYVGEDDCPTCGGTGSLSS